MVFRLKAAPGRVSTGTAEDILQARGTLPLGRGFVDGRARRHPSRERARVRVRQPRQSINRDRPDRQRNGHGISTAYTVFRPQQPDEVQARRALACRRSYAFEQPGLAGLGF